MADKAFAESIAGLLNSERFSDVTIVCEGRRFHAHKAVICTQSDFFAKACEGSFKEGQTGVIELKDDNTCAVVALLGFLYTKHYQDQAIPDGTNSLTFNVRVFALAEKFFVQPLLRVAAEKFRAVLRNKYVEDEFAEAIEEWTATTSDDDQILGKIIVETIIARKRDLLDPEKTNSKLRDMMNRIPWLAAEIAMMLSSKYRGDEEAGLFFCPGQSGRGGCGHQFVANAEEGKRYKYDCPNCRRTITFIPEDHRRVGYPYFHLERI